MAKFRLLAVAANGYELRETTYCQVCGEFDYLRNERCIGHQNYIYGVSGVYSQEEVDAGLDNLEDVYDDRDRYET